MQISNPYLNKYILPHIDGDSVLDVGSGIGYYGYLCKYAYYKTAAAKPFKTIDAVEASPDTVKDLLQMKIYNNVHEGTCIKLPFLDRKYDTVLSLECLEHLYAEDLEIAFKELYRVCNKKLIISTPPPLLCSNKEWCANEVTRITKDVDFIDYEQYIEHMYGLHKCSIDSDVFMDMKFKAFIENETSHFIDIEGETRVYVGNKDEIDISKFRISKKTSKWQAPKQAGFNYKDAVIIMLEQQIKIGE